MTTTYTQDKRWEETLCDQFGGDCQWVVDFVRFNFKPEDVFNSDELEAWAENYSNVVEKLRDQIDELESELCDLS